MIRQITPEVLAEKIQAGQSLTLIDCRQPWENKLAALPGSQLIPLGELAGRVGEIASSADVPVVVYCHHGVRSMSAAGILERAGIENVYSLAGGIEAWSCEVDPAVPRY